METQKTIKPKTVLEILEDFFLGKKVTVYVLNNIYKKFYFRLYDEPLVERLGETVYDSFVSTIVDVYLDYPDSESQCYKLVLNDVPTEFSSNGKLHVMLDDE